jgi:hypothetical protein
MMYRTKYQAVNRVADVARLPGPLAGQCVFVAGADEAVNRYLADRFASLSIDEDFLDALPGHLPGDRARRGSPW